MIHKKIAGIFVAFAFKFLTMNVVDHRQNVRCLMLQRVLNVIWGFAFFSLVYPLFECYIHEFVCVWYTEFTSEPICTKWLYFDAFAEYISSEL